MLLKCTSLNTSVRTSPLQMMCVCVFPNCNDVFDLLFLLSFFFSKFKFVFCSVVERKQKCRRGKPVGGGDCIDGRSWNGFLCLLWKEKRGKPIELSKSFRLAQLLCTIISCALFSWSIRWLCWCSCLLFKNGQPQLSSARLASSSATTPKGNPQSSGFLCSVKIDNQMFLSTPICRSGDGI